MWNHPYATDNFVYGTEPNAFLAGEAWRIPKGGAGPVPGGRGGEKRRVPGKAGVQGYILEAYTAAEVGWGTRRSAPAWSREATCEGATDPPRCGASSAGRRPRSPSGRTPEDDSGGASCSPAHKTGSVS